MLKQEFNEIKRLYRLNHCSVDKIAGCYVNGEKEIKARWKETFLALDEEDMFKYMEIFKKVLGGHPGKTLKEISFGGEKREEKKELFQTLRNGRLSDEVLDEFYEKIIDEYDYVGNYLILVVHDTYDIPGKTTDGIEMEDASDEVYEYILAVICPVSLQNPALAYDAEKNIFTHMDRDWVLGAPVAGILYPALNDRSADLEHAEFYIKAIDSKTQQFAARMFGEDIGLTVTEQRNIFADVVAETLGNTGDIAKIIKIEEELQRYVEDESVDGSMILGKEDVCNILSKVLGYQSMNLFDEAWRRCATEATKLDSGAVTGSSALRIHTEHGSLRVDKDWSSMVSVHEKDGKHYLVAEFEGDIVVNGIKLSVGGFENGDEKE